MKKIHKNIDIGEIIVDRTNVKKLIHIIDKDDVNQPYYVSNKTINLDSAEGISNQGIVLFYFE